MNANKLILSILVMIAIASSSFGCANVPRNAARTASAPLSPGIVAASATLTFTPIETTTATPTDTPTATPQSRREAVTYGPDAEDFPAGYNPLTGLPVDDPAMLDLPAVLISVTNFPVSARPQAGLSFAAYIYEIYIAEGMTRFLTAFYGEYPMRDT